LKEADEQLERRYWLRQGGKVRQKESLFADGKIVIYIFMGVPFLMFKKS
jgi:hypothetical protein